MASSTPQQPAALGFQQAFQALLSLAPGPVFPRARLLYLRKYHLEGAADRALRPSPPELTGTESLPDLACRFRTFLLAEEIQEASDGLYRVRARSFAVVHWQAPQTNLPDYGTYLRSRWGIEPEALNLQPGEWFRNGGAYALFSAAAVYERRGAGQLRLNLADHDAPGLL